jgi:mannose-6-phosphate isomerase-like protein (cupin superfamily)
MDMMDQLHIQDLNALDWKAHPFVSGVMTKIFENQSTHPLADVLVAHVESGGEIPWHVHESASETAYVLVGEGVLKYAEPDKRDNPFEAPLKVGVALTIPGGWWHTVLNTGAMALELFAFHTPPTI